MLPWNKPIYSDPNGPWGFLPRIHRPGQPAYWDGKVNDKTSNWRPGHDDWPVMKSVPRTYTAFIFISAKVVAGDPKHYVHRFSGDQWKGPQPFELTTDFQNLWIPKPWGLRDTYQEVEVEYMDPVTLKVHKGIYKSSVSASGLGQRVGPRISDEYDGAKPYFYVNTHRKPFEFLTYQIKRID